MGSSLFPARRIGAQGPEVVVQLVREALAPFQASAVLRNDRGHAAEGMIVVSASGTAQIHCCRRSGPRCHQPA